MAARTTLGTTITTGLLEQGADTETAAASGFSAVFIAAASLAAIAAVVTAVVRTRK